MIRGILVVNVKAVETVVFQQSNSRLYKVVACVGVGDDRVERGRVGPTADREEHLEMSVLLLEFIDGFEIAIKVVPDIIPGVTGVVDIFVRPNIRQDHLAVFGSHVGERIKDMSG